MLGTTLQNRYRLDAEVGCGSMGTVYRAYATSFDQPVALMVFATRSKSSQLWATLTGREGL
jgi:hypothetical protein